MKAVKLNMILAVLVGAAVVLPASAQEKQTSVVVPERPPAAPTLAEATKPKPPEFPADVQTMVKQFQQDRERLMAQLKSASEEERKRVLGQLQEMREQFRQQMADLRQQARDQADKMRENFNSKKWERPLKEGSGSGPGSGWGPGGRPR